MIPDAEKHSLMFKRRFQIFIEVLLQKHFTAACSVRIYNMQRNYGRTIFALPSEKRRSSMTSCINVILKTCFIQNFRQSGRMTERINIISNFYIRAEAVKEIFFCTFRLMIQCHRTAQNYIRLNLPTADYIPTFFIYKSADLTEKRRITLLHIAIKRSR